MGEFEELPSMIKDVEIPLVPGKGTPTQAYVTLRQMKLLEIPLGGIKMVKMKQIQNIETGMYITQMMKQKGIKNLEDFKRLLEAPSMQYVKTTMTQARYTLGNSKIKFIPGGRNQDTRIETLRFLRDVEGFEIKPKWLKKYNLTWDDKIYINYDIFIDVKYIK